MELLNWINFKEVRGIVKLAELLNERKAVKKRGQVCL